MLKKIASRVDGRTGVIAIEASDPVPYVASQPDPRTFVVELRDVVAVGFADDFTADPRHPIVGRAGRERAGDRRRDRRPRAHDAHAADAAARPQLAQRHLRRSRSRRCGADRGAAMISMAGPASGDSRRPGHAARQRHGGHAARHRAAVATSIEEPKEGRAAARARSAERDVGAARTRHPIEQGPVERVRIGLNPEARRW